jgi:integrase
MAGNGTLFRPKVKRADGTREQTRVYWMSYSINGKQHRESTHTTSRREANDQLHQRVGDRRAGKLVGRPDQVTLAQLRALVERQYALDGRKSVKRVQEAFANVEQFFGADARVAEISKTRIDAYAAQRLAAGRKRATVNNELAQLRRGFSLAIEAGLLAVMPAFKLPNPHNARSGFFEEGDFAALLLELPPDVRDLVQFLHATGWRRDEGRLLQWAAVDMEGGTIRLEEARSKSGKPRVFPFGLAPALKALLDARWEARDGMFVFHRDGKALGVGAVRSAWKRGCLRAGLATKDPVTQKVKVQKLIHDLRRTAARDCRRAGLSEGEVMLLGGWETRTVFDRYNIINEADLAEAVAKRFGNSKPTANIPPAPVSPESLTSDATT